MSLARSKGKKTMPRNGKRNNTAKLTIARGVASEIDTATKLGFDFLQSLFASSETRRVFVASRPNDKKENIAVPNHEVSKAFCADDIEELRTFFETWDIPGRAMYFGVGVLKKGKQRRRKVNVLESCFLHADIDMKLVVGDDRHDVLRKLRGLQYPPSVIVSSGHGFHCYWLFDEAVSADEMADIEVALKRLAAFIGGDPQVTHIAAFLRMVGSHNSKRGEWTPVRNAESSWARYNFDMLAGWLETVGAPIIKCVVPEKEPSGDKSKKESKRASLNNPYQKFGFEHAGNWSSVKQVALENLSAWVPLLFPTARTYNGGYRVSSKDLGRDLEEDLTIMPNGIKDFGVADMGDLNEGKRTAIDLVMEYHDCDKFEAVDWLRDKLGIDDESDEDEHASEEPGSWETPRSQERDREINEPLPFIDVSDWDNKPVPPREWAVPEVIPQRNVFMFSGEGSAGKSEVSLQRGAAHMLGKEWLGMQPKQGPFLYFGAEDDEDEVHRRLHNVLNHYHASFADIKDLIHLLSYAGDDAVLASTGKAGIVKPTILFERLLKAVTEIQPIDICLDTVADVFAGNEVSRTEVRQFVGLLRKLAIKGNAAVTILAHPSLTGINTGTGLSGSTGWHNSVRARAFLKAADDEDGEPDSDLRLLEFKKNNYGPIAKSLTLLRDHGIYTVVSTGANYFVNSTMAKIADDLFMTLLKRFNQQRRYVSEKPTSKTYAPHLFYKEDEAKKAGISRKAFEDALRRLFVTEKVGVEVYGPPSKERTRLMPK
jgi:RecA-family ATPase